MNFTFSFELLNHYRGYGQGGIKEAQVKINFLKTWSSYHFLAAFSADSSPCNLADLIRIWLDFENMLPEHCAGARKEVSC